MKKFALFIIFKLAALVFCADLYAQTSVREVSRDTISALLEQLDNHIVNRRKAIDLRQNRIDSIKTLLHNATSENVQLAHIMDIASAYTSFNTDSALHYYTLGMQRAPEPRRTAFILKRAALLPLVGMGESAKNVYDSISPQSLPPEMQRLYYDSARQAYSYISSFYGDLPDISERYAKKATEAQAALLELLPKETQIYKLNMGEYFFNTGEYSKGMAVLEDVVASEPIESNIRARAAHLLSTIAHMNNEDSRWIYYLLLSAISDMSTATLEVASLQDLGTTLYQQGDIDRAYTYLSTALENAVMCHASMRTVQSAKVLPVIEHAYNDKIHKWRIRIYVVIALLVVMLVALALFMFMLHRDMKNMKLLQERLSKANRVKEVYISRFLSLCSIYMDKLSQLTKIVERKLSSGKADELLRMTRSGKFVEEQSKEFYEVFDDAFLHLYPKFVVEVNKLLQPDQQIILKNGEKLNTDLRILAFMRLGIDDSARISQVLNYSLNTIYTYRNKLKNKAINRETFEDDVMRIPSFE